MAKIVVYVIHQLLILIAAVPGHCILVTLIIQSMVHGLHGRVGRGVVKHVGPDYQKDNALVPILHQLIMDMVVLGIQSIHNNVKQDLAQVY